MFSALLPGLGFGFTASIVPGPLQAFLMLTTLRGGWKRGLWVVPAPMVSDAPIVAICLALLSQAGATFLRVLSACGALFLAWLAHGAWRELRSTGASSKSAAGTVEPAGQGIGVLGRAAVLNGVGPGPWVFWTSVMGPLVVSHWRDSPTRAILVVAAFYGAFLASMSVQVALFAQARRLGERAVRVGSWFGFGLLVLFSAWLALRALGVLAL